MSTVLVTGGNGFLGSHLIAEILKWDEGKVNILTPSSMNVDFRRQDETMDYFNQVGPIDKVFNLAANVGGIGYNIEHPYALYYDNLMIGANIIHASVCFNVKKFIQIGTVCSYPKNASLPFKEVDLWDGYPEHSNAPYGIAKKAALVQLRAAKAEKDFNFIYLMPTNLYGPGDDFSHKKSHVISALIRRFLSVIIEGEKEIVIWGTGEASRDFIFVSDAVETIYRLSNVYNLDQPLNIGSGSEVKICVLANMIKELTGFEGSLKYDTSRPDGQPKRSLSIANLKWILPNWSPKIPLREGLKITIDWFKVNGDLND